MCGIIGIIGREPVAPLLIDALKRLEYRGYDSAGVATLEHGVADAPARRRQAQESGSEARARAAVGNDRHRPHPLGDARPADREQCASARHRPARGRAQRHHREFQRVAARAGGQGRQVRDRDRQRGGRASRHRGDEARPVAGRGGRGGAAAAARRLRARLSVRRRGEPADRRAQGLAAGDRLRRRRDVSRLRCDRARAVHRHGQLSGGRRLGRRQPRQRRNPRRRAARSCTAPCSSRKPRSC